MKTSCTKKRFPIISIKPDLNMEGYIHIKVDADGLGDLKLEDIPMVCKKLLDYYCDNMIEYKLGK